MASSSCSLIESFKYDVFLSFRGEDTRKNFVGHLYEALEAKCIETYKDDEKIKKGERINDQLLKSIEDSRFYIIVFSKTYASSSWCLDELVKIIECQKMTEHTAFPVFYDVEPTEVRKLSGAVKEAFAEHEKKEAAGKWRDAMKELADLAGWELKATANGDESKLIQIIVDAIFKNLHSTNSSADGKLVGMETRISDILLSLEIGTEDVRMIGIKGMGGGGKTTLATTVYDQISNHFEAKSFVENVREVSQPSLCGLKELQKRILEDVLNKDITVSSVHDGKNMLKATMRRRKILVVLDDVDCIEQLEALAGEPNWFKRGSRIIITTRDEQVLLAHRVNFVHDVNLLSSTEAICLFSRHAFQKEIPIRGYEALSGQVVQYADGLPLTIKVMGSFLCGQSERFWIDAIERLKTIPLKKTLEKLELSFDGLEKDYKEIFLDVACILKGWLKDEAIRALESRGFHAEVGLRVLEHKSLITYNENGKLWMHDHLEEMGRNIVRRSHPDEPQRHSRLWDKEEIEYILTNNLGTKETKCLYLRSKDLSAEIAIKGLAKMKDLKVLFLSYKLNSINWKFDKVEEYLPSSLRFMRWVGIPFSSLPNTFHGKCLVGLEMDHCNIVQLWEDGDGKVLYKLRFLKIKDSKLRTFDLRLAPNLESLIIDYCYDFEELHIPADHHSKLEHIELTDSKLKTIHLRSTSNLEELTLKGCNDLVELEMPAESLKLKKLNVSYSKLKTIHFGSTPNLEELTLEGCNDLVEVEMPVKSLKLAFIDLSDSKLKTIHLGSTPNLEELTLEGCNDELEMPAESLKLKKLNLSYSKLKTIHFGSTPNLEELTLEGCNDLVELHMPAEIPKLEYLDLSHSKLKSLHLGNTPNLKKLKVKGCNDLVELHMPAEIPKVEYLDLSHSKLMSLRLGNTPNLKKLKVKGCNDLVELEMPAESLKLAFIDLRDSKLKTIHIGSTPNLEELTLHGCNDLIELEMPIESLKLKNLNLSHSKLKTVHLGSTPNLEEVTLNGCNDLVELEMPVESLKLKKVNLSHSKLKTIHLGSTPNLQELTLYGCNDLVELEMPVESLKLKKLNLSHSKLKTIHLGSTPNLEELTLHGCNELVELEMPVESLKLAFIDLSDSKLMTIHLGSTSNLEELTLYGCHDLVELEMPAESLKLKKLNLSDSKLKTIHLGSTPNLEELTLNGCNDLVELEMPAESLKLKKFYLSDSKLKSIHLGSTPNLEELTLYGCHDLVELEIPAESLKLAFIDLRGSKLTNLHLRSTPNLEELRLDGCHDLVELQMPAESLKLTCLNLSHSKLKTILLGSTPNLEELTLDDCNDLVELEMPAESQKLAFIDLSHSKLTTLDLGVTPNLKWLKLKNCYDLVEINTPVGCLRNLAFLDLSGCGSFKSFLFDKWSQPASAGSLSDLHLIAEPTDDYPLPSDNDSPKFQFLCYYKEDPASSFGNLERLISIGLCACTNLESFSRSICSLQGIRKLTLEGSITEECLEELTFSSTDIKYLPDNICMLKHLKCLEIKSCWLLEKLPDDISRLESLETLILTDCKLLQDIPKSICTMKCMHSIDLRGCIRVVELPEEIGSLEGLKELNIEGTGITGLPQSIFKLRGLRIVGSIRLIDTNGLLLKRRRTSDDDERVCYI